MMKERFAKLLLGEDMSGCGNGVATALAISNAITNLCGMQNAHLKQLLCFYFLLIGVVNFIHLLFLTLIVVVHFFDEFAANEIN